MTQRLLVCLIKTSQVTSFWADDLPGRILLSHDPNKELVLLGRSAREGAQRQDRRQNWHFGRLKTKELALETIFLTGRSVCLAKDKMAHSGVSDLAVKTAKTNRIEGCNFHTMSRVSFQLKPAAKVTNWKLLLWLYLPESFHLFPCMIF